MQPVSSTVIAPAWAVLPIAAAIAAWALWHAWRLQSRADITRTRRRVRTINAVVIVLITGLAAYGLCAVTPSHPRTFVATWTGVTSLALVMAALALIDLGHTAALAARGGIRLNRTLRRGPTDPQRPA